MPPRRTTECEIGQHPGLQRHDELLERLRDMSKQLNAQATLMYQVMHQHAAMLERLYQLMDRLLEIEQAAGSVESKARTDAKPAPPRRRLAKIRA